ncbi:MAG: hypothetical protein IT422_06700 [Pirellulaceae bacterium]|nr:hypothetical protein [Pirellulaceae bacterium]
MGVDEFRNRYAFHGSPIATVNAVAGLVRRFASEEVRENAVIVAFIQAAVVGIDVGFDALDRAFGPEVAQAVMCLSRQPDETNEEWLRRLQMAPHWVRLVKACDLAALIAESVAKVSPHYLNEFSEELTACKEALGDAFSGQLRESCSNAAIVAAAGMSVEVQVPPTFFSGGELKLTWKTPVSVQGGLVVLGTGTAPCRFSPRWSPFPCNPPFRDVTPWTWTG